MAKTGLVQGTTEIVMRLSTRFERPLACLQPVGWLAVLAMVALSSPGLVTSVRAESPASAVPAGPSCNIAEAPPLELEKLVEAARKRAAADPSVVVLNNRGYRYGNPAAEADVEAIIQRLIAQQRRQGE